jgi:choline monooxygenase
MPEFQCAQNFPTPADNLAKIQHDHLGNFLFAALKPVISFEETILEVKKRLHWMPFDKMQFDASRSRDYMVQSHWALYCENYLEGFHIPFVHKGLRSVIDFPSYKIETYRYSNLQLAIAGKGEHGFDLPKDSPDYGKNIAAYYYWLFPNTMLNFYPWGCSVNVVQPLGLSQTKVSFLAFVMDESRLGTGAGGALDTVELEDEVVVESVQKGVRSRFYNKGRYSPTQEQGTHHFHRLLCDFLG